MNIQAIDSNFKENTPGKDSDLVFRSVREAPFTVCGLIDDSPFLRIPADVAKAVSERVSVLNRRVAGGRVRFTTDSQEIAIRAKMPHPVHITKMASLGSSGFDMYSYESAGYRYMGSFVPTEKRGEYFDAVIHLPSAARRDITVNFPIFEEVEECYIGVTSEAELSAGGAYRNDQPILYYGSSITQGQCVSRPGNIYEAIISRRFNCDYRNLGWSGNAKGEIAMAEYISRQPMCLFVMDYDHNSPTPQTLAATHEAFFLRIREENPTLPILIASKTDRPYSEETAASNQIRKEIIRSTYENAVRSGDKHVYFLDGSSIFAEAEAIGIAPDDCTVDGVHPTDLGYALMAKAFGDKIRDIMQW